MGDYTKYEQKRINQLHEERMLIQKKTFTKWMNTFLQKAKMEVDDIFVDLADGKKLLKLLEIISGEKLAKPNNGTMRLHKIENVNKALAFLHTKVKLESIGAEDIVDGNKTLILGLLWTIILRFQIQDIEIQSEDETDKKHSAKEALLLWCQRKTKDYPTVRVRDFTQSWRDGMAFNALIHSHRPELVDFEKLDPKNSYENLNNAFTVAKNNLAIQPLLDPEDVDRDKPDEKSILTYVSSYYHTFAKYNSGVISGKRIANIISQLMEIDRLQLNYELHTTNLLNWIQMKIHQLDNREFPNNLEQIQNEFINFKEYRTVEKPLKYKERSEIEALLFQIQTKRKSLRQSLYSPPEGKLVQDINKNWIDLEKAEHKRELALREERLRLERINNLAESFYRKSELRRNYLTEMIQVLSDPRYGNDLSQVEATIKKHEAISADIFSRSARIDLLSQTVNELKSENYFHIKNIEQIFENIKDLWKELSSLLDTHRNNLLVAANFMRTKHEIETIVLELNEINKRIIIDQNVTHLWAAEECEQKHSLLEAQISSHGDKVKKLTNNANKLLQSDAVNQSILLQKEIPNLKKSLNSLQKSYQVLNENAALKRQKLIKLLEFYRLLQDIEEEEATLAEKLNICQAILPGKDLLGIISLQQKHYVFEAEVKSHEEKIKMLEKRAENFGKSDDSIKDLFRNKLDALRKIWNQLLEMINSKSKELSIIIEAFQYHADANETESWLKEKMQLANSEDYGQDEQSATSLLKRHKLLESEIAAYGPEIERLNQHSDKMISSDVESLFLLANNPLLDVDTIDEEIANNAVNGKNVQQQQEEEVYEDVEIPQVYVLYNFKGKNYSVKKGEVLMLINKTTPEWWEVSRNNLSMYVPSNYVREIEPKVTRVLVNKQNTSQNRAISAAKAKKRQNNKRRLSIVAPTDTVEQRKSLINSKYKKLVELCKNRRKLLEDSIKMFKFNQECESFENWLNEMQNNIQKSTVMNKEQKPNNKNQSNELSKQFEKMITDLLANKSRLETIDEMYKDMNSTVYLSAAKKRREQIHKKWDQVHFLQKQLGKNIEGLTSVETFDAACNETLERINNKWSKITEHSEISHQDLKTAKALQREHENLERELITIEESLKRLKIISENVKSSYPLEKSLVDSRLQELNESWEQLKRSSEEKRNWLDRMIGLQIFKNSSTDIIAWLNSYCKPMLKYDPKDSLFKNVDSVETLIAEHNDLLDDIKNKYNDIEDLKKLAEKLKNQVDNKELQIVIDEMDEQYRQVYQDWINKKHFLEQCRDVSKFNQEADRIETMINSDLTFLEYEDTGNSCDDVISLMKRHEAFLNTLNAQDQRVYNMIEYGKKLLQNDNFDSDLIKERQLKILERRKMLKDKAYNRMKVLNDAKQYHEIKSNADEFSNWCNSKRKSIKDLMADKENLQNSQNLERKWNKHQTLAAEVRANKDQLDKILNDLNNLNTDSPVISSQKLNEIEQKVQNEWHDLNNLIEENGKLLRKALDEADKTKSLKSINERVDEIKTMIAVEEPEIDRRSCKNLLQQNKLHEQELVSLENKLLEINNNETDEVDGMKNAPTKIDDYFVELKTDIQSLKKPLNERKQRLLQLNEYHQFEFDADSELQWIKERISSVSTNDVPQNLTDAQNWVKKIEQNLKREVEAHEKYVDKIIQKADELIEQNHPYRNEIKAKSEEIQTNWKLLSQMMNERIKKLKIYLKIHQFLSECNEIESWLNEKNNILNSPIYGKDENTYISLLEKLKSMDLEIDFHASLIQDKSHQANELSELVDNDAEKALIHNRVQDLVISLKRLQKLSSERKLNLMNLKQFHEYYRESNDFLDWIRKQKQILSNKDYGKDYEHCTMLQTKFFDLKRLIMSNEKKYHELIQGAERFKRNDDDNRFTTNIDTIHEAWEELMNLLHAEEQKFIAAVKFRRFDRDITDALERIQEKSTILNNQDYGRDCQSTHNLIRKHDIFENDLVALEAQLQILINDMVKLKAAYPGENSKRITEKMNSVLEYWEKLKNVSAARKQRLLDTYEYHRFISSVRNLQQWALNLIKEMKIDETNDSNMLATMSVDKAQNLKNLHERIHDEMESRQNEFQDLVNEANNLSKNSFYSEIKSSTEKLLALREELYTTWQWKNVFLDQLIDYCIFMRDAKQLEQLCQHFRNRLDTFELGTNVEEASRILKKFEDFIKVFASHETKFQTLEEYTVKLIDKKNSHSDKIQSKFEEIMDKKHKLSEMIAIKKDQLSDELIYLQFKRDGAEFDQWIEEKQNQVRRLSLHDKNITNSDNEDDIEVKLKKFQKHQTLETEINANLTRITDIQDKAKHLISRNHPNSIEVRTQHDNLINKWNDLQKLIKEIDKGFEEAKDIYEFNKNIGHVESWIREKESMIQSKETGEDFEHCESLLRKLDDVDTGMKVDENEIAKINELANKLINQCKNENQINEKRLSMNEKWQKLQQKISEYRNRLVDAREIHLLNRDLDDINERITEKHLLVSKECDAKNLASVEMAQRKHEALCDDINAIDNHFKNINENDVRRLINNKNPEMMEKPRAKIQIIQENLRKLMQECGNKSNKLKFLYRINNFFEKLKEYENWSNNMLNKKLSNVSTSTNVSEAKNELLEHEYLKAELLAKKENNQKLKEDGFELLQELEQDKSDQNNNNKIYIEKLEESIEKIDENRKKLDQAWVDKFNYLKQCEQLHKFNDLSKHCDLWLTSNEALLTNEDLGANHSAAEELLKKHDSFVQSLAVQPRIEEFSKFAEELIENKHFDSQNIQIKLNETLERRDKLMESAKIRKRKLEDSKQYYNFYRNVNEIRSWLVEKLKVSADDSYKESTNLLSKKQKHAGFEAEINSNKGRIEDVISEGESLIKNGHFRSDEIKEHLSEIEKLYRQLNENNTLKRNRLNEAHQALQFFRQCDDLLLWLKDMETVLNDQDNGKDLTSVRTLLKKHKLIEVDVHNHNENIENIKDQMVKFRESNHFQKDEIEEKGNQVIKSFNDLQEPMYRRREILEEYLTFYMFKNDVEHEHYWIKEKESQLNQLDNANTVSDIQRLMKKHKMIDSEIQNREPQLSSLITKGHSLLKSDGANSAEIKRLTHELQTKIQYIKDASALKRLHLADSLESHQFYSDVVEAESWIQEKMSFLLNEDNGQDEESVAMLLKRLEALNKEAERFHSTTLTKLIQQSKQLVEKNHSEKDTIEKKAQSLNEKFQNLTDASEKKKQLLLERSKYFVFEREADELILWIKDQQLVANSPDYGEDVEHVESLIQQFETFITYIASNEDRIFAIENEAKNVKNSEKKLEEIHSLWNALQESIITRKENLQSAFAIHRFHRSADETICWIREKESSTALDNVNPDQLDINTIKTKIRQLEGFEHELNALRVQVESLFVEAEKLSNSYVDVKEDIESRKQEVQEIWNDLQAKTIFHKKNLLQIENIQSYFDKYQELLTWINEKQALITADDKLLTDVTAAEQQLDKHREYEAEIKSRDESVQNFIAAGNDIIAQGHIMSKEIQERNSRIKDLYANLKDTWQKRLTLYEYNVDARQFVHDVDQIEKWIAANHNYVDDNNFGDSIAEVENLLEKHEEFEKTILAQEEKLNTIERITMIEKYFENLKREEEEHRAAEESRREKERLREEEEKRIMIQRKNEEQPFYENLNTHKSFKTKKNTTTKTPKRINSFAFSKSKTSSKIEPVNENLPPIACEGFLDRKHLLQKGTKASSRSWKTYYTLLCGHLLCFFKDKNAFKHNNAASAPFSILNARVETTDYKKKKHVFSIELEDSTKYLFVASNDKKLREWINAISFRAMLPPSKQLIEVESTMRQNILESQQQSTDVASRNGSDSSSSSRRSSLSSLPENLNSTVSSQNPSSSSSKIDVNNAALHSSNPNVNSAEIERLKASSPTKSPRKDMSKYGSLPPNMAPIKEIKSSSSIKKPINETEMSEEKPKKRKSFFSRNK